MEQEKKTIENRLISFFIEMNKWEKNCNQIENDASLTFQEKEQNEKKIVSEIFEKFCTKKDRLQGLPNIISFGNEGSYIYDPIEEKITEITFEDKSKAIATTRRNKPIEQLHKFSLKKIKEIWLIDSKKRYSDWQKKWLDIAI